MWLLLIARWRLMFSRTTLASSMRMPTASERAISVIVFRVKPKKSSAAKVPITKTGSGRPIVTVERQECRNRNTIATVRSPPSTSVLRTFDTELRMPLEESRTTYSITSSRTLA